MDRIIRAIESAEAYGDRQHAVPDDQQINVADAIGKAACDIAKQTNAAAIVTLTRSGGTARLVAKYRPATPIIALSDNPDTLRALAFTWGVQGKLLPPLSDEHYHIDTIRDFLLGSGLLEAGSLAVFSSGSPLHLRGTTNMLEVRKV
ncbi:MAG: hypothetical protein IH628_12540 [Proteobacteria bacterium]|nr:hypothetical protein [Pseudomonadota bacterium]